MIDRRVLSSLFLGCALGSGLSAQGILLPGGTPDPNFINLHAWYDAANGPNSSATPLPHGTAVTQWDDLSVNGYHLSRISTDPARVPTANDDQSSCGPAIRFDGNDFIWTSVNDPFGRIVGARTIFCVGSTDTNDTGYLYDGATNSGRTAILAGQNSNRTDWQLFYSQQSPAGSNLITASAIEGGRTQIHTVVLDFGAQEYFLDGSSAGSDTNAVAGDLGGLILGARVNTANGLSGYIREVLVYNSALSASDRQAVEGYLRQRHPRGYGVNYGSGCAGSGGFVPNLFNSGCPSPGQNFDIVLDEVLGGATCSFAFSTSSFSLPVGPCTLLVDPTAWIVVSVPAAGSGPGAGSIALPIGVPTTIFPGSVYCQVFALDAGAAPFGISMSNGLELVVR